MMVDALIQTDQKKTWPKLDQWDEPLINTQILTADRDLINSFDIDGVIWLPKPLVGLRPEKDDVIITGRSYEEEDETYEFLESRGIHNEVYFNPARFNQKTRQTSGLHKANTLLALIAQGFQIGIHWEDDLIQAEIIRSMLGSRVQVIHVLHNLVDLGNVKQGDRKTWH